MRYGIALFYGVFFSYWFGYGLAEQQQSKGFWEDSHFYLLNRTVYDYRNYRHGGSNNAARNSYKLRDKRNGSAEEWGYGLMGRFESGFTQGTIGFGMDAFGYLGVKFDSGGGRAGKARLLAVKNDGHVQTSYERLGVAAKLNFSSTLIKYGDQHPKTPLFSSSDSRLLPETARGLLITSNEIKSLYLQAGHFTAAADRNASSSHNDLVVNYANPNAKQGNAYSLLGGIYQLSKDLSVTSYIGRYQNNWYNYYLGGHYQLPLTKQQALTFDFNLYHTKDYGKAYAGEINNTTWSFLTGYSLGYHRFSLGYQKVQGNTPFDYVTRGAIWLTNAVQLSDFNAPHEQSWQLAYQYDLSAWQKGLLFSIAYVKGNQIDGTKMDKQGAYTWLGYGKGGKHWERDIALHYTIADSYAKGLKASLRYNVHRANKAQAELDTDQIRFAIEYPLNW